MRYEAGAANERRYIDGPKFRTELRDITRHLLIQDVS